MSAKNRTDGETARLEYTRARNNVTRLMRKAKREVLNGVLLLFLFLGENVRILAGGGGGECACVCVCGGGGGGGENPLPLISYKFAF